jgi:hypothetical protein
VNIGADTVRCTTRSATNTEQEIARMENKGGNEQQQIKDGNEKRSSSEKKCNFTSEKRKRFLENENVF